MSPFHNNKLKTIGLDDSDDQSYSPNKTPSKGKNTALKPNAKATTARDKTTMGQAAFKRKRGGDTGTPAKYEKNANINTNNGYGGGHGTNVTMDEHISPFIVPNESATRPFGHEYLRPGDRLPDDFAYYGGRLHENGYDIDIKVSHHCPTGAPSKNSFGPDGFWGRRSGADSTSQEQSGDRHYASTHNYGVMFGQNSQAYTDAHEFRDGPYSAPYGEAQAGDYIVDDDMHVEVKEENDQYEHLVSATPLNDSECEGSDFEEERATKALKLNKDGAPRKPRQPRAKLLKWSDNDWKNVVLGIIWACGETGVQIPFDQAAQVVGESCTAGALQQAILKLRGKQVAEGNQIPSLRMAWTRKNKNSASLSSTANGKNAQDTGNSKTMLVKKKPTRFSSNQTLIVTLKRSYQEAGRMHLDFPYKLSNKMLNLLGRQERAHHANATLVNENLAGNFDEQSSTLRNANEHLDHDMKDGLNIYEYSDIGDIYLPGDELAKFFRSPSTTKTGQVPKMSMQARQDLNRNISLSYLNGCLTHPIAEPSRALEFPTAMEDCRKAKFTDLPNLVRGELAMLNTGEFTPDSTMSSQSAGLLSGASSTYGMSGTSANGNTPTTPASSSAFNTTPGMPVADAISGTIDNVPATGETSFSGLFTTYPDSSMVPVAASFQAPVIEPATAPITTPGTALFTPPRSARRDDTVYTSLCSSLRQNGAFNPQGNSQYEFHPALGDIYDIGGHFWGMCQGDEDAKHAREDPFLD